MKDIKTVFISTASLPHEGVASWTTLVNYLLEKENQIDYIIGPISNIKIKKPKQIFIESESIIDKVKKQKKPLNRFNPYIRALQKVLAKEKFILLQVQDNFGLLKAILEFVNINNLRERVFVQYHYHSFLPFTTEQNIIEQIDELVLLSESSYQVFKSTLNTFAVRTVINNNGIDGTKFKPVDAIRNAELRKKYNISSDKLVFVWCSQNRKKKGLDMALQVWSRLLATYGDRIELFIFGVPKKIDLPQVRNMGLTPNEELVEYYQLSDFYLFPTLWQEGFGLSLLEALKCGAFCIASRNGAVPEVLQEGLYGKLIDRPNFEDEWVKAISESIEIYEKNGRENPYLKNIPDNFYEIEDWCERYNQMIVKAKKIFHMRYYIN